MLRNARKILGYLINRARCVAIRPRLSTLNHQLPTSAELVMFCEAVHGAVEFFSLSQPREQEPPLLRDEAKLAALP